MNQENLKKKLAEKDKQSKEMVANAEKKYAARDEENQKQIKTLEKKLKESKLTSAAGGAAVAGRGGNKVENIALDEDGRKDIVLLLFRMYHQLMVVMLGQVLT